MGILDIIILIAYLCAMLAMGAFIGKKNKTSSDYFSGGRSMPWYAIGLSVGLTMISANSFIGGPGWAYQSGIISAMVNITVPLAICFVTYTILPVIYNSKVTTVYEYVNLRLGVRSRLINVIAWLMQSLVLVGGFIYTPSLVLSAITGISINIWIPAIMVLAIVYTVAGGIKAVIWTDMIQAIVLALGLVISIFVATGKMGVGIGDALDTARTAGMMTSFDFVFDLSTMNIWALVIGGFAMWAGYFGFDQGQVQRYITSKDMKTVKKTGVLSSLAMQVIYWLCFFFGIILFSFYQSHEHTLDFANANNVMTDFLLNYCPPGLLGLLLAATFAAAMSSIDSVLNSLSAVFTKDIYEPYISKKKDTPLSVSMMFSLIFGVLIVAFSYLYLGGSTSSILQTIAMYIAPFGSLLTGTMIICCFLPSVNDKGFFFGSILSVIVSLVIGKYLVAYWIWSYFYGSVLCIGFSWIMSKFFKNEKEYKEKYKYSIYGVRDALKGQTEESGCSIEPLKLDRYAGYMMLILVVQIIILAILQ